MRHTSAVALLLVLSFHTADSKRNAASQAQTAPASKIPLSEAHFTPDQLKQYYLVYKNPDVIYLRTVFDAYLQGKTGYEEQFKLLKKWEKDYYKSKFIVMARNQNTFGGTLITIMFEDRPDKVFVSWVYPEGADKTLTLRRFELDQSFNDEDIKRIQTRYRQLLDDKVHAM